MKKWLVIWGILLFIGVSLLTPRNGYATSWKKIPAKEVIGSSEVIVQGKYDQSDFDQKRVVGEMWVPFKFTVERYYKGTGATTIDTAIEQNDSGWVKEFQEHNGSFILFLKRDSQNEGLLIPVGGPNGIVELLAGKIQNRTPEDMVTYNEFIESQAPVPVPQSTPQDHNKLSNKINWYWIVLVVVLAFGGVLLLFLILTKRRSTKV
jgi:hypothetical protein